MRDFVWFVFFFFKQKTAYEIRKGDWSSDVCSSDLALFGKEPPERRLAFLTPVVVPDGVDELRVRRRLIEDFGIEIGAAFGQLQGRIWRIGTMGYSASRRNVLLCLAALEHVLRDEGWRVAPGAGVDAALAHYASVGADELSA